MKSMPQWSWGLFLGLGVFACTDDVTSGDEVVADDESTQGTTDDEAEADSSSTSTEDESSSSSDESDTVSETESTSEEESSSESTSEDESSSESTGEEESSSIEEESSSESSSSSEEESSSDDGMMDTDTEGNLECGNGMLQVTEACDDGNDIDGDGCESDCTFTVNIDWVVVHEAINPMECSSIFDMKLRADGNVATAGLSKENSNYKLHVATWDADDGDVLAEHFGNSLVNGGPSPRLDAQPDGDLLVAFTTAEMDPNNTIGTIWRFGPDLDVQWMKTAFELGILDTNVFKGVLGKPDGGMLTLSYDPYISNFDAQGQLIVSEHVGMATFDFTEVGGGPWALGARQVMNVNVGALRTHDLPNIELTNETLWELNPPNYQPDRIERRGNHVAAVGTHPHPTVWRFDQAGELIATHDITQLGNLAVFGPSLGLGSDGSVAVTTLQRAMGLDPDGTLLWHLPSSVINDMGMYFVYFRDALIDDQGRVYIGGYDASDTDCFQAVLIRISW